MQMKAASVNLCRSAVNTPTGVDQREKNNSHSSAIGVPVITGRVVDRQIGLILFKKKF